MLEKFSPDPDTVIREEEVLPKERFDDYLLASDAAIFHKFASQGHAVVSSTAFQALGAGCPILVPQVSDFFRPLSSEIRSKEAREAATCYVEKHSPENIAKKYIEIFDSLLKETR